MVMRGTLASMVLALAGTVGCGGGEIVVPQTRLVMAASGARQHGIGSYEVTMTNDKRTDLRVIGIDGHTLGNAFMEVQVGPTLHYRITLTNDPLALDMFLDGHNFWVTAGGEERARFVRNDDFSFSPTLWQDTTSVQRQFEILALTSGDDNVLPYAPTDVHYLGCTPCPPWVTLGACATVAACLFVGEVPPACWGALATWGYCINAAQDSCSS
jgi:hypothetical protein